MKEQQEPVLNWESLDTDGRRELMDTLRGYIRTESYRWFEDPNITSVGVGLKVRTDQASGQAMETDEVSLQFTVGEKKDLVSLESDESALLIPERIDVDGVEIVTDVLVRTYEPKHLPVSAESFRESDPKRRQETLRPGLSLGNEKGGTGTLGLIVYDQANGTPYMLSNWHVIHGLFGEIGDTVVQPGKRDDNGVRMNAAGRLVRSYLDIAGDCAIASIEGRAFDQRPLGLDVIPDEMVRVEIGDRVIKSGRTTHVTYGIVRRVDVNVRINYKGEQGEKIIGGFEIGIDQDNRPQDGEVSRGGDSGAAWLIANGEQATSLVAGLHFAGESDFVDDEFALANYPSSVFKKLGIALTKPTLETETAFRAGYDEMFLGVRVGLPRLPEAFVEDAVKYNGLPVLPYTHFSVVQSEAMGFARLVAWNIDGGSIKRVSTNGVRFRLDPRVERDAQTGNELYKNNTLDRGHIARRADLCWGSVEEARQANYDSYYYTNIAPQHEAYNQSSKGGIWGRLENKVFEDVDVANLRLSVMAGPIFTDADPVYRDTPIPRSFWKVLVYQDAADGALNIRAFVLTQQDLLNDLEALGLEMFQTYEVSLDRLFDLTELDFSAITDLGSDGGSRQSLEGAASLMVPPATRLRTSTTIRAIDREEEHSRLF